MAVTNPLPKEKNPRRKRLAPEEFCPIRQTLKILGKRWTILIIKEIYYSKKKKLGFMDLRRKLSNVSSKVLSERLKEMEENKLIKKKVISDNIPLRVSYSLTSKGKDVCAIVEELRNYGLKWGGRGTINCENIDCELCAQKREGGLSVL